jgi:hypothetical protein
MRTATLLLALSFCVTAASAGQYVLFGPKPGVGFTCPWDCC